MKAKLKTRIVSVTKADGNATLVLETPAAGKVETPSITAQDVFLDTGCVSRWQARSQGNGCQSNEDRRRNHSHAFRRRRGSAMIRSIAIVSIVLAIGCAGTAQPPRNSTDREMDQVSN